MTPSRWPGYPLAQLVIIGCRSVHEMIWTILMVSIIGFGLLPGTIALTLFCIGFSGKLFTETIEAIAHGQVEAMRATGANELQVFVFGVLPQLRVAWAGIGIYTWDVVFRAATVVGFFGAGGMGWYLRESVQKINSQGDRDHSFNRRHRICRRGVFSVVPQSNRTGNSVMGLLPPKLSDAGRRAFMYP